MRLLSAIILLVAVSATDIHAASDAIDRLDRTLDNRGQFIEMRLHTIDSLKHIYSITRQPQHLIAIGDAYRSFANDSALHYFDMAANVARTPRRQAEARLRRAALLPLAGFYESAISSFENIDTASLAGSTMHLYHDAGRQLYSFLASAYEDYAPYRNAYLSKAIAHQKDLLTLLNKSSDDYLFNLGEYYFLTGDTVRAEALLNQLTERTADKALLARAHHHLATIAGDRGDEPSRLDHLANSAIADIESATLEVRSLQQLGLALYTDGDISRSYRYLSAALDNAVKCGATLRMIESSRALPIIADAYNSQKSSWQKWLYAIMALMAALLIGLAVSLVLLRREMKRLGAVQLRLRNANHSKDIYIGQFLQLCSIYMDKLNRFCKIAERKISAGKADEFYRMTK